ncbi:hypothetical protein V0M98_36750 (plasmid) [Pseudomonas silesiensis]|uniref:hypothetical protein n=1 Tax=Pseudomonas silesiensis TaxID=1853130 RepID=UPI0030CF5371
MKIPVCKADFDDQAIAKIARLVSKTSHSEKIGLSKAKEVLSISLGYKDYHDLNKSICQNDPPHAGSPDQIKLSIAENVASRFAPDLTPGILSSLEYWGLHRLRVFTVPQRPHLPSEVIEDISQRVRSSLGQHLGRRLSMAKPSGDQALGASQTVAQYLTKSLPPLLVVKDLVHEEINEMISPEYASPFFVLNEYRMMAKKGVSGSDIRTLLNLEPLRLDFLEAVSTEFEAQLAVDIPTFLARYGLRQQNAGLTFHDLASTNLFD